MYIYIYEHIYIYVYILYICIIYIYIYNMWRHACMQETPSDASAKTAEPAETKDREASMRSCIYIYIYILHYILYEL